MTKVYNLMFCLVHYHRSDSISGTDYVVNPLFLYLKVSRTTIGIQGCARFAKILLSARYCGVYPR